VKAGAYMSIFNSRDVCRSMSDVLPRVERSDLDFRPGLKLRRMSVRISKPPLIWTVFWQLELSLNISSELHRDTGAILHALDLFASLFNAFKASVPLPTYD
jgi:hypothetical protein